MEDDAFIRMTNQDTVHFVMIEVDLIKNNK